MLNLKTAFAAIIFSVASTLCAQELPWPTDPEGDEYRVDSAYGPRDVTEGTFFHKGIDLNEQGTSLNEDINQPIIAAANGAIFGIGRTNSGIHWIGIDYGNNRTFAYLHVFPNGSKISNGNFSDVVANTIAQNNEIRSCRRVYTDIEEDANRGVMLFYSGLNNTGRIVKALGITDVHIGWEQVRTDDLQIVAVNDPNPTASATTIVVSAGTNGVIETMLRGDDYILGSNIAAGTNLRADSMANHVFPQTSVVAGEIIAPLGTSGATNAHLHLQISHADEALNNTKGGVGPNDGWDNVVQYLQRDHLDHTPYSGGITFPGNESLVYHTDDHNHERVKARIRWRPEGENLETYHQYELDRVRIFAVPSEIVGTAADFIADNTYLINRDRAPTTGVTTQPNPSDAFRSEFDYGGRYAASNNIPFDNAFPPFIANTNVAYRSNGIKTGLNPLGQLETNPVTEFVFNQWNTRINKTFTGLASINSEAAYPDGEYKLFAVAESVDRDNAELFISTSTRVHFDNHRPYVEGVKLTRGGDTLYSRGWALREDGVLVSSGPETDEPLTLGRYAVTATISEYLDIADIQLAALAPIPLERHYEGNKKTIFTGQFDILPQDFPKDELRPLVIGNANDSAGNGLFALDPDKTAIHPLTELTRSTAGVMQGSAGADRLHYARVDVAPPIISYNRDWRRYPGFDAQCDGANTALCGTPEAPVYIRINEGQFNYADIGSGIKEVRIYKETLGSEPLYSSSYAVRRYSTDLTLPLPDGRYVQTATDNLGRASTMYFRIDPVSPRLEISSITASPPRV